ncbi:ABC transporter substrate-binding protein [Bacillus horti]|uniref:Iron complex transport system substrate-binding protein n=1 Tax=Caldalkalibacillus horti TaxID=77523 RepID=A0ABT9VVW5_9BACI|nr:iron-siderophore ABC transporter substrate-binding protein [Bacillus horti]MDQ0165142.1 iron complex transport system substrate-binding protein [Bacillus horti]
MQKKSLLLLLFMATMLFTVACSSDSSGDASNTTGSNSEGSNEVEAAEGEEGTEEGETEASERVIQHAMGETIVPANPQRIVVLTGDALEAVLSVGLTPVGSTQAMGDRIWYEHLEDYMDGVTNVGAMSTPDLEAIQLLEPDLILGAKSRQEESYDLLSEIAPTVFTESHTLGQWKADFRLYLDAANKLDEGEEVLAAWEGRAAELSQRLDDAGKLDLEVGILRFTAGQGRFFYNMSYSGSIVKELGFARPANHDVDDQWVENITQERIPEFDADVLFYFVLDSGDGQAVQFADEWIETQLFQELRAAKEDRLYEVNDGYWNMTYGILSADYVLEDIERHLLGE